MLYCGPYVCIRLAGWEGWRGDKQFILSLLRVSHELSCAACPVWSGPVPCAALSPRPQKFQNPYRPGWLGGST